MPTEIVNDTSSFGKKLGLKIEEDRGISTKIFVPLTGFVNPFIAHNSV